MEDAFPLKAGNHFCHQGVGVFVMVHHVIETFVTFIQLGIVGTP